MNHSFLQINSLCIELGKFALKNVEISCDRGEYHILLGPTGSGKSTLMKSILGLHKIDSGDIYLDGNNITKKLPEHRGMGYVPQNYALFPHLNVEENIRFGFHARKTPASQADALVNKLFGMLKIEKLRSRTVHNLSGGEKQKVALGRALCIQPEMILLDEPFSSIDEGAKRTLWFELKQIVKELGITTLHITHNLDEAYTLGERVSVIIDGDLVQSGQKQDVFERPANESIARYLNYRNIFEGVARAFPDGTRVEMDHFSIMVDQSLPVNDRVKLCIRGQDIKIVKEGVGIKDSLERNVFEGTIVNLFPLSDYSLMWFKVDGSSREFDFEVKLPRHIVVRHDLYSGKAVRVAFWEPKIIVL
ncbi:MAG: ABC transporter ATP-binding protein [Proteobacteria bacterium]|nr:ABC transporter ATP-binding protein [Pseudomonadota bacterium]